MFIKYKSTLTIFLYFFIRLGTRRYIEAWSNNAIDGHVTFGAAFSSLLTWGTWQCGVWVLVFFHLQIHAIFFDVGWMVSRRDIGVVAEPTFPSASRFVYLCENAVPHYSYLTFLFKIYLIKVFMYLFIAIGTSNGTDRLVSIWNWSK